MKYDLLAIMQIVLFIFVMPQIVGFVAGLIAGEKARERRLHLALGLVVLIDLMVMIDKGGVPFIVGHVVNMFLYTPLPLWGQLLVGLAGDAVLLLSFNASLGTGIGWALRLRSRSEA